MIRFLWQAGGLLATLTLVMTGCELGDDGSGDSSPGAFELAGTWSNNYGGTETFTETEWDSGFGVMAIASYDNHANWVVMQSPEDDEYTPNLFSKTVWLEEEEGVVYTCTVAYELDTIEEAEAAKDTSDATDPLNEGCKGFGWTQLLAAE
jgi:hypothetical protein